LGKLEKPDEFSCDNFTPQDTHSPKETEAYNGDSQHVNCNVKPTKTDNMDKTIPAGSNPSPADNEGDKTPSDDEMIIERELAKGVFPNQRVNILFAKTVMKQARAEALKDELGFLEWLYSVIGDESIDYMMEIDYRVSKLKQKLGEVSA